MNTNLQGCHTALITPFTADNAVDYAALESFVQWQVAETVHGVVPCGTTGESPTLSHDEHKHVIERTVKAAAGKVKVMAGTGSNATQEAIDFTRYAEKAGADSVLIVAPYYNKPTQEGLFQHFQAVAKSTGLPVVIYNIPGRSVVNIADDTLARLAETCPNIAGIKDATGDLARVASLRHKVGDRLALLSGEDITAVGFNAMGGVGVISVTSNIAPRAISNVQRLCAAGSFAEARVESEKLTALHHIMFCETNPAPVKYAASLMGKCRASLRLPMVLPSADNQQRIAEALGAHGLLSQRAA